MILTPHYQDCRGIKRISFLTRLVPSVSSVRGGKESRIKAASEINASDKLRQVRENGRRDDYDDEDERAIAKIDS